MTTAAKAARFAAPKEAVLLLGAALLLTAGAWALRAPRLPLRADAKQYQLDLGFPIVAPATAVALYQQGDHLFVDTRDRAPAPRIPGSFQLRQATFDDDLLEAHDFLGPQDRIVLYGDGNLVITSAIAARLRARGYAQVSLLQGDLAAWQRAGGPVSGVETGHDE